MTIPVNIITTSALLMAVAVLNECTTAQRFTDRLTGFYRRGSCISIDIPPITLTPAQTAEERQLIGREVTIEEEGWIIPSGGSRSREGSNGSSVELARRLYREEGILDFFEQSLRELRSSGVLGEGFDGNVHYVPDAVAPKSGKFRDPFELQNARKIAEEINLSRRWIYGYHLAIEKSKPKPDLDSVEEKYRNRTFRSAKSGEWILTEDRRWERVR